MSNFLFYALAFALLLGVLIIAHEYGHYFVARCAGVRFSSWRTIQRPSLT